MRFMATIKQVEKRSFDVEGFNVRIRHGRDRRDVRSDKASVKQYGYRRALAPATVSAEPWSSNKCAPVVPSPK